MKSLIWGVFISIIITHVFADDPIYIEYRYKRKNFVIPALKVKKILPGGKEVPNTYLQFTETREKSAKLNEKEEKWLDVFALKSNEVKNKDIFVFSGGNPNSKAPFTSNKRLLVDKIKYIDNEDPYFFYKDPYYYCSYPNSKIAYKAKDPLILREVFAIQKSKYSGLRIKNVDKLTVYDLSMSKDEFDKDAEETIFYSPYNSKIVIPRERKAFKFWKFYKFDNARKTTFRTKVIKVIFKTSYHSHLKKNYKWRQARMINRIYSIYEDDTEIISTKPLPKRRGFPHKIFQTPWKEVRKLIQAYDNFDKVNLRKEVLNFLIYDNIEVAEEVAKDLWADIGKEESITTKNGKPIAFYKMLQMISDIVGRDPDIENERIEDFIVKIYSYPTYVKKLNHDKYFSKYFRSWSKSLSQQLREDMLQQLPRVKQSVLEKCAETIGALGIMELNLNNQEETKISFHYLQKTVGVEVNTVWEMVKIIFPDAENILDNQIKSSDYETFFSHKHNQEKYFKEIYKRIFHHKSKTYWNRRHSRSADKIAFPKKMTSPKMWLLKIDSENKTYNLPIVEVTVENKKTFYQISSTRTDNNLKIEEKNWYTVYGKPKAVHYLDRDFQDKMGMNFDSFRREYMKTTQQETKDSSNSYELKNTFQYKSYKHKIFHNDRYYWFVLGDEEVAYRFADFYSLKKIFLSDMRITDFIDGSPSNYKEVIISEKIEMVGQETVVFYPNTTVFSQVVVSYMEDQKRKYYVVPIKTNNRFAAYFTKGFCKSPWLIIQPLSHSEFQRLCSTSDIILQKEDSFVLQNALEKYRLEYSQKEGIQEYSEKRNFTPNRTQRIYLQEGKGCGGK